MGLMAVMLGVALGFTGYFSYVGLNAAFPAWCLFHPPLIHASMDNPSYNVVYVGVAAAFLITSYLNQIIELFLAILNQYVSFGKGLLYWGHQSEQ